MNNSAPAVCPRCGAGNLEGRQFCVSCAEPFVPPNQMMEAERANYLWALRNWCLLYLDPIGGPPPLKKETCWLCKEEREPDALFCGNCGAVFSSLLDLKPSPIVYQMMLSARLARFRYLAQQGKTPIDYGVRDFTSWEEVRAGIEKSAELAREFLEQLKEVIKADFQRQEEEARARAEEAVTQGFLDNLEPVMQEIAESDRPEKQKQEMEQLIEDYVRDEVAPAYVKTAIAAREHGRKVVQKTMYYGLPLEIPDEPWSDWSRLSKWQQDEMLRQHKLIQKWWECATFLAMVGLGLTSPFVVLLGLLMGFTWLKGLLAAVSFGVVLVGVLNVLFLSFFSPQLASPLNRALRFLGPLSLLAGILLSWFMAFSLLPVILVMIAWFFASPYISIGMRIPVWRIRQAIISRLEPLPSKPE